jgi:hypothetical protein
MFNLAIDSKLRGCDVVSLRVEDVAPHGHAVDRATVRQYDDLGAPPIRNQKFADSPVEGDGFELPVPRSMQARLKAKIAGFGCMRPSILRLPSSVAISSGAKRNLGPEPLSGAEPEVRIHLPPAESLLRT